MPTVTIRPGEPDEATIPQTVGWEEQREVGRMRRLLIDVERSELQNVTLNRKSDTVELGTLDPARLVDVQTGGATWTLVCYSFEWDANRVAHTAGGNRRTGTDQALITGLINEVPTWNAGTVNSFTGDLAFVFNHAHRHEALRRIEKNVGGELLFRDSGTVDYIDRLGSDLSGSVELSSDAGTIENEIRITERGRELDGTHVRVLGAHEGEAQLYANLVPADDPASYDNRVDYTTSRWSSGDARDWDRWVNKDVTDQATLEEEAAALGAEITEELVEAETTIPDSVSADLGDTVQVVKADANLDRAMRIHRVTTKAGGRNDTGSGAAVVHDVLLSTRTTMRHEGSEDLRDIQRFNTGWQGSSVAVTAGPFGKAVDSGSPLDFNFKYPELEFENTAEIHIKGLPYRIDSQGAASGGGVFTSTDAAPTVEVTNSFATGYVNALEVSATETIPSSALNQDIFASIFVDASNTITRVELEDTSAGDTLFDVDVSGTHIAYFPKIPINTIHGGDRTGNTIEVTVYFSSGADGDLDLAVTAADEHSHTVTTPDHTHPADPGIFTTADTPSNVDVSVNGNQVATNVGSGTFETVISVPDEFANDSWNTISVSSDSLGIIEVAAFVEGYDQIGAV